MVQPFKHVSQALYNRRRVLTQILLGGAVTRTELANLTGLTGASISRITRDLIAEGLLLEAGTLSNQEGPGRRFVKLEINPHGGYVIGFGINAFEQVVRLTDLHNQEIATRNLPLESLSDPDHVLDVAAQQVHELIKAAKIKRSRVLGAGVAIAGSVDVQKGILLKAPTLGWQDVPIAEQLDKKLKMPVRLENLPNALNLAEVRFGKAQGNSNTVLVNATLRLGVSMMLEQQLVRGGGGFTGMLGNIRTPSYSNQAGSDEQFQLDDISSGHAILKIMNHADYDKQVGKASLLLRELLGRKGDSDLSEKLYKAGLYLGRVIEMIATLFQPGIVIISGILAQSREYVEAVTDALGSAPSGSVQDIPVLISDLKPEVAASWLAIYEFLIHG